MSEKPQQSNALREAFFQYLLIAGIIISALSPYIDGKAEFTIYSIIAICISLAVNILGGYIKKIAEIKINEYIAKLKLKDDEIITLKEQLAELNTIKTKLINEIAEKALIATQTFLNAKDPIEIFKK